MLDSPIEEGDLASSRINLLLERTHTGTFRKSNFCRKILLFGRRSRIGLDMLSIVLVLLDNTKSERIRLLSHLIIRRINIGIGLGSSDTRRLDRFLFRRRHGIVDIRLVISKEMILFISWLRSRALRPHDLIQSIYLLTKHEITLVSTNVLEAANNKDRKVIRELTEETVEKFTPFSTKENRSRSRKFSLITSKTNCLKGVPLGIRSNKFTSEGELVDIKKNEADGAVTGVDVVAILPTRSGVFVKIEIELRAYH